MKKLSVGDTIERVGKLRRRYEIKLGFENPAPVKEGIAGAIETLSSAEIHLQKLVKSKAFIAPTVEDVEEYNQTLDGMPKIDAERFVNHYAMSGWRVKNGVLMKDWRAAVRLWAKGDLSKGAMPINRNGAAASPAYDYGWYYELPEGAKFDLFGKQFTKLTQQNMESPDGSVIRFLDYVNKQSLLSNKRSAL